MIKKYLQINGALVLLLTPLFYIFNAEQHILGYFSGGILISINMAFLVLVGELIFLKKSIAKIILFIVFKYALLGVFIYQGMDYKALTQFGFILGISTCVPSLVFFVVRHSHLEISE